MSDPLPDALNVSVALSKRQLRRQARQQHAGLDLGRVVQDSDAIRRHLCNLPAWTGARTVHTYVNSLQGEVITRGSITAAKKAGMRVLIPYVDPSGPPMRHAELDGLDDLQAGHWGLEQPLNPRFFDDLSVIDVVLVPGLIFDLRGYRIGQGGGFYDRFLAALPDGALTVGLTYDEFVVHRIPNDDHDIPVHLLATPSGVHAAKKEGG
jgi:5-formyltetrahydrofolate cyclo-ligase